MSDAWILLPFIALFVWKIYQYRKAIIHNMNLYGNYIANVMQQKVDEKKNETRKNGK